MSNTIFSSVRYFVRFLLFSYVFDQALHQFMVIGHYKVKIEDFNFKEYSSLSRDYIISRRKRAVLKQFTVYAAFFNTGQHAIILHQLHFPMGDDQDDPVVLLC